MSEEASIYSVIDYSRVVRLIGSLLARKPCPIAQPVVSSSGVEFTDETGQRQHLTLTEFVERYEEAE